MNTSNFFISAFFLQIIPVFSSGRDQLLGRARQENIGPRISPRISPLHEFRSQGWTALFDLIDTVGPKV